MESPRIDGLVTFFKALSDPSRLRIVGLLLERPHHVDELANRLDLSAPTVSHHLKKLAEAELVAASVQGHRHVYAVHAQALQSLPAKLLDGAVGPPAPPSSASERVLAAFMVDGKLKSIPAQRKKRLVILERLARELDPVRRYRESEVNEILRRFHPDVATLRRELVVNGLAARRAGIYWRCTPAPPEPVATSRPRV